MKSPEVPGNPYVDWMVNHPEELRAHAGKRVAIHPDKGIIASGDCLSEVYEQVENMKMLGQVVFDVIPDEPFCGSYAVALPEEDNK